MPLFYFSIDPQRIPNTSLSLDLDDAEMARRSAKYVLRQLAAREASSGSLSFSAHLKIEDFERNEIGKLPIRSLFEIF